MMPSLAPPCGKLGLERAEGEEEYVEVFHPILVCLVFEDEHLGLRHSISCENRKCIRGLLAFDIPPIVESLRSFVWFCCICLTDLRLADTLAME